MTEHEYWYLRYGEDQQHREAQHAAIMQQIAEQKHYGFYQLCPKCDGEKFIAVPHVHHGKVDVVCSICKGEGVIPRPEIKNMQP